MEVNSFGVRLQVLPCDRPAGDLWRKHGSRQVSRKVKMQSAAKIGLPFCRDGEQARSVAKRTERR